ncbi:unnamed protein product [Ectocarpus sp. 13 AM-2016]
MATASLPPTAYVPVGSEFDGGRPLGQRVRFNGVGGVRKDWWWQPGPVDSCCCCFSLAAGVAVLAAFDVIVLGAMRLYYLSFVTGDAGLKQLLAGFEKKYAEECEDVAEASPDCLAQASIILSLTKTNDLYVPAVLEGVIAAIFGFVGLRAVFAHDALAARAYLWSWPPRIVLILVELVMQRIRFEHYDMGFLWKFTVVWNIPRALILAYCLKVVWSYWVVVRRNNRAAATAADTSGSIELDGSRSSVV